MRSLLCELLERYQRAGSGGLVQYCTEYLNITKLDVIFHPEVKHVFLVYLSIVIG